jgi:hypothetical protein
MDPLQLLIKWVMDLWATTISGFSGDVKLIFTIEAVGLIVLVWHAMTCTGKLRQSERGWSDICGSITNRMERLLPHYTEAIAQYTIHVLERTVNDRQLVALAKTVSPEIKAKAHRDFVIHDIARDEATVALIMQLRGFKRAK